MNAEGLILAGGESTRMGGFHKGNLAYRNITFTEILVQELRKETSCVRLSYGREIKETYAGCPIVTDIYPGCGPIGGIHAGLKACVCDRMLVAACDMPFLKAGLFRYLEERLRERESAYTSFDGAVPVTGGRVHPLAAIYRRKVYTMLEEQIERQNYRIRDALKYLRILYIDVTGKRAFERMLQNINTPEEYERMLRDE